MTSYQKGAFILAIAKEQLRQIIRENDLKSVGNVYTLSCIPETHHDESDVFRITITSGVSPTMA